MYLDEEILIEYGAPASFLNYFIETYKSDATAFEIIIDKRTNSNNLLWLYEHIPLNEDEVTLCFERLKIKRSEYFVGSKEIEDCSFVFSSRNCVESSYIKDSYKVERSLFVNKSNNVKNSENIFDSKNVSDSKFIGSSKDVFRSENVLWGIKIYDSFGVKSSSNIVNSRGIVTGLNLMDCFYCAQCSHSTNLLFCANVRGADYMIFNKQVTEERYNEVLNKVKELACNFYFHIMDFNITESLDGAQYGVNCDFRTIYASAPSELWEYLKSLSEYDGMILYMLTSNAENLKNS